MTQAELSYVFWPTVAELDHSPGEDNMEGQKRNGNGTRVQGKDGGMKVDNGKVLPSRISFFFKPCSTD